MLYESNRHVEEEVAAAPLKKVSTCVCTYSHTGRERDDHYHIKIIRCKDKTPFGRDLWNAFRVRSLSIASLFLYLHFG